jgi:hypothetical protein
MKLLQDLQDARTGLGQVRARLQSAGEKLLYTAARSPLVRGNELKQELTVIRKGKRGPKCISVDQDSELQPGRLTGPPRLSADEEPGSWP